MIVVTATMIAHPGQEDALRDVCASLLDATRLEDGCVEYVCGASLENPRQFQFVEVWSDMDALKAHTMSDHMVVAGPLMESLSESQVVDAYFADKSRRLKPRAEPTA